FEMGGGGAVKVAVGGTLRSTGTGMELAVRLDLAGTLDAEAPLTRLDRPVTVTGGRVHIAPGVAVRGSPAMDGATLDGRGTGGGRRPGVGRRRQPAVAAGAGRAYGHPADVPAGAVDCDAGRGVAGDLQRRRLRR